jgi:hypothetical protein
VHHDKDFDVSVFVCDDIWNDWIPLNAFGAPTETQLAHSRTVGEIDLVVLVTEAWSSPAKCLCAIIFIFSGAESTTFGANA